MNRTPFYDSCYQQEDDNDILLQLLKSKISTDESIGSRTLDCDKDVFRQKGGCVIARNGDRFNTKTDTPKGVCSKFIPMFTHLWCGSAS